MADATLAIKDGFDFQAHYFWYKACTMFAEPNIKCVSWEDGSVRGFDDVGVHYEPARLIRSGQEIHSEFYQVKFHVTNNNFFTSRSLVEPEFIGATTESLLNKLHKRYIADKDAYTKSLFTIANTWTLDKGDLFSSLIDNDGAILLDKLFDGTTDKSRTGKVRKLWRENIGVNNDELRIVLKQFRVRHSEDAGDRLTEKLNLALHNVGLQVIESDKRTNPYEPLITQLQREKKIHLDREQLREALQREQLWVSTSTATARADRTVGVRTFQRGTDAIMFDTDSYLCLLHNFSGRFIVDASLWATDVIPQLSKFTDEYIQLGHPITLHLDTHLSVAFAAGYFADVKSGVDVGIIQKTFSGRLLFRPNMQQTKTQANPLWAFSNTELSVQADEVAICLCVTHNILPDVQAYISKNLPNVGNILTAIVSPQPSGTAITDGDHAVALAENVIAQYRDALRGTRATRVHLFIAAPNAFAFFLGQRSKLLGNITLYEYDFENVLSGTYEPAINLPQ